MSMMSSTNSKQIDQILLENEGFLKAIQEFQAMGKVSEVMEFQKRLQINLLQLVDSTSVQFKVTQRNPEAIKASSSVDSISCVKDSAAAKQSQTLSATSSNNNIAAFSQKSQSNAKISRSSFSDMPKI